MGCLCSTPAADDPTSSGRLDHYRIPCDTAHVSTVRGQIPASYPPGGRPAAKTPSQEAGVFCSVQEVLEVANRVVHTSYEDIDAVVLATLALSITGGQANKCRWDVEIFDHRVGICEMPLSSACWLASEHGCSKFGTPSKEHLMDAERALYYAAGFLRYLASYGEQPRSEEFVVRGFVRGPKGISMQETQQLWQRYQDGKRLVARLHDALQCSTSDAASTMHIVQPGETLSSIAKASSLSTELIMGANPELAHVGEHGVEQGDCIMLPVEVVLPRLHAVRPGDTLESIAEMHEVAPSRLLRSLAARSQPWDVGVILEIPGLEVDQPPDEDDQATVIGQSGTCERVSSIAKHFHCGVEDVIAARLSLQQHRSFNVNHSFPLHTTLSVDVGHVM